MSGATPLSGKRVGKSKVLGLDNFETSSALKKERLLNKKAAKDANYQRRLIIGRINKDAFKSELFRAMMVKRKNKKDEDKSKNIAAIDSEGESEEEEEAEDQDDMLLDNEDYNDDFLDREIDCKVEVMRAKKKALFTKT